jgi:hypothetical protein
MTTPLIVAVVILFGTIISIEVGFRWGQRDAARNPTLQYEGISAVEASAYALLGLLLGFSFSGAMGRMDSKRELVVSEVNAIGTAYLRVDLLSDAIQPAIREQYRKLIEARVDLYQHRGDAERAGRELATVLATQQAIWTMSVDATASSPGSAVLVIPPINEMIDLGTALRVSVNTHLPGLILTLLVGAAILSGLLAGYSMAKRRQRSWFHVVAYAALLALTVYTVLDLDHPRFGLINMDAAYQPLMELRSTIR